jgi:hypothetical protein
MVGVKDVETLPATENTAFFPLLQRSLLQKKIHIDYRRIILTNRRPMKVVLVFLFALLSTTLLLAEFDVGVGFGWNTIDETFNSKLHTNENKSGRDRYSTSMNRLAALVQLGYRFTFCSDWTIGMLAQWKYLNYKTANDNSSRGQILPNATFSSINIFGPEVRRDFTSKLARMTK